MSYASCLVLVSPPGEGEGGEGWQPSIPRQSKTRRNKQTHKQIRDPKVQVEAGIWFHSLKQNNAAPGGRAGGEGERSLQRRLKENPYKGFIRPLRAL